MGYICNVMVQAFGVYLQWLMQLGWFTDAFGQLEFGEGRALDARQSWGTKDAVASLGADPNWMNGWTIFYWGWWIAWSPFVGIFLARISKGRSVREVINFTFSIPLLYCVLWFSTFGGAGIKMHRRAELLEIAGKDLYNNNQFWANSKKSYCFDVPAALECPTAWTTLQGINTTDLCKEKFPYTNAAYVTDVNLSPVCKFSWRVSTGYWFDVMDQNYDMGTIMNFFSIFTIIIYFVTSSDSGSLVVDFISTNGEEAHWSQRIYWAFTEGFLAIALLLSGGSDALKGLRSVSIVSGVPLTIFCCLISLSLYTVVRFDTGEIVEGQYVTWAMPLYGGMFDYVDYAFSMGRTSLPDKRHVVGFFTGLIAPPYCIYETLRNIPNRKGLSVQDMTVVIFSVLFWVSFVVLFFLNIPWEGVGLRGPAVFCYLGFACTVLVARHEVRGLYRIEGSLIRDFLACCFVYNQAAYQAQVQVQEPLPKLTAPEKETEDLKTETIGVAAGESL